MIEQIKQEYPAAYQAIKNATEAYGFTMQSEVLTCSLLKTLAASKPGGKFLELGTGTGLATTCLLDGMDSAATLVSIDNDDTLLAIAKENLGTDKRLQLVCADANTWIEQNVQKKFNFVFADTWAGKYQLLNEILDMIEPGGIYFIDDMLPQANWPEGHAEKANALVAYLDSHTDVALTKMGWASGIIIAVKK